LILKTQHLLNSLEENNIYGPLKGAAIGAGLTGLAAYSVQNNLDGRNEEFEKTFEDIKANNPSIRIDAYINKILKNNDVDFNNLKNIEIFNSNGQSLGLKDYTDYRINEERLKAMREATPGLVAGGAAIGAIGATLGQSGQSKK
jgi:hypothetical protein